jgi:tRNA pseudouridine13 synthase
MTESFERIRGKVGDAPEDFVVEEVWQNYVCDTSCSSLIRLKDRFSIRFQKKREYLHFTLVKRDWDTTRALNRIRRKIGVSLKRFGIAGMKDKRAVTAQRVSLWKGDASVMVGLKLRDLCLKDFAYSDERITLGNAVGNRFTITVRDLNGDRARVVKALKRYGEIASSQGVPNYYGPQRLSGNVEVGCALKEGNLKLASEHILEKVQPWVKKGEVEAIPKVFWYEKRMIKHLGMYPNDYAGALRKIPKRIRRLYVHAYQSHVFNEELRRLTQAKQAPRVIAVQGFAVPRMPELSTKSFERRTMLVAKGFKILSLTGDSARLRFTLDKGEYASTFLSHLLGEDRT